MLYFWVIAAALAAACSGIPALFLKRTSVWSQRFSLIFVSLAAGLVLYGASGTSFTHFPVPAVGRLPVNLDPLGCFFLIPAVIAGFFNTLYSSRYWESRRHPRTSRKLRFFWGLMLASLILLVISRHALLFLLAWEGMALSAFFLITTEDQRPDARRAGWIYFVAAHISLLLLFALFALWRLATGSFLLQPSAAPISPGILNLMLLLALVGFGLKAGVMPLHFWLPGAHANAPSHVSALLSGVVLKMGIYGLLRFCFLLPQPPAAWGSLILILGAVSSVLGVVYALAQHDLKRFLAYHSIENIGIILMGLGLALLGRSYARPEWIVLGMAGCLLHVWNHSFFKSLLFLAGGALVHVSGTRQIDELGGAARRMPWTAALFLTGAVAISGLPPLNGFVSEFFLYLGLLGRPGASLGASLVMTAAPVLALTGALAVACFVKAYGTVFLGAPRTPRAARVHEVPWAMRLPMLGFAALCVLIGLHPILAAPLLDAVIAQAGWNAGAALPPLTALVPFPMLTGAAAALAAGLAGLTLVLWLSARRQPGAGTWDCGYAAPTPRMQYTAASYAQPILLMFGWLLRPRVHRPRLNVPFPRTASLESHIGDVALDRIIPSAAEAVRKTAIWLRRFQQGLTQAYVLYLLICVAALLATLIPWSHILERLAAR